MSVARLPQLGSKPVALTVKLAPCKAVTGDELAIGLQEFYRRGEFADVVLVCAEQRFLAHRVVLASQSHCFREGLSQPLPAANTRHEIGLSDIANPEAVKILLDHMYQLDDKEWAKFNPRTQDVNREVLRLAAQFGLPGLTQQAMHWLSKDLTTGNVVERLSICDEFGLTELSDKILEQLTNNREALAEVANSPQITSYPKLMQAMLQCAAGAPEAEQPETPSKKGQRGLGSESQQKHKRGRKA